MLEQQRIEYLQAMGIQLWMPRKALDYAAEPSWLVESGEKNASLESSAGASFQAGHAADLLSDMGFADVKPNPQSMAVALRALTAQWEFMSGQGARGWVSMDDESLGWLTKVTAKPLFSVSVPDDLYCTAGKKALWHALRNLSLNNNLSSDKVS
jgi:hypothetical protein